MALVRFLFTFVILGLAASAAGQPAPAPAPAPATTPLQQRGLLDLLTSGQWKLEQLSANHWRLTGDVEWEPPGSGLTFSADQVELFTDTNTLTASGNVVFTNPEGRIAAERMEYDWNSGRGTFYQASGIMSLGPTVDRAHSATRIRRLLLRRRHREEQQPRSTRSRAAGSHLRAADAAMGSHQRQRDDQSRRVRDRTQHGAAREGRSVDVPSGRVLPDPGRRARHRFLMPTYGASPCGDRRLAMRSSGPWDEPGRDVFSRLVHAHGQAWAPNIGTCRTCRPPEPALLPFVADPDPVRGERDRHTLPESRSSRFWLDGASPAERCAPARAWTTFRTSPAAAVSENLAYATNARRVIDGGVSAGVGALSASAQYMRSEVFSGATRPR